MALQEELAPRVVRTGAVRDLRLAAGVDAAFSSDERFCIAGVVVWDVAGQRVVEQRVARRPLRFPYVPGLLSFREAPAILAAVRLLRCDPDVFLFDGQGYAHPRRFGLACHVGLWLDRPSVGCAKSRLIGTHPVLEEPRGSLAELLDDEECIGAVLRTRASAKPLFVSIGHRVSLAAALRTVMACCTRYRLPEPTRLADQLVARAKLR